MKKTFSNKGILSTPSTICTIAFAAISGLFFSCAKEELDYGKLNLIGEPRPITVNATLPKSACTDKTTIGTDGKVCWDSTDAICVNGSSLSVKEIISDTLAVFAGKVGDIKNQYGGGYWATYPTSLNATTYSSASVSVTLPATQTYNGTSIPNYMAAFDVADGDKLALKFKNLCSIVKIPVQAAGTGNAAKLARIEITSATGNRYISGASAVTWSNGNSSLTCNGGYTLTLDCGNTDVSSLQTFSIMIPANSSYHFTMRFYDADGNYMQKKLKNITLERSKIYTTGNVALNANVPAGALPYTFNVSETSRVRFSDGNLQWSAAGSGKAAGGTWRFAENQYDVVGNSNANISSSYSGWIDLFGWGTSGYEYNPYMTSTSDYDYGSVYNISNTNNDWGVYNAISNGGNKSGLWRTLTRSEWSYLLDSRTNAGSKYGTATVNGVNGIVLLPDEGWELPGGLTFSTSRKAYTNNQYTESQWQQMEANGAAFLPAAGYRAGTQISSVGTIGYYWSGSFRYTWSDHHNAHIAAINGTGLTVTPDDLESIFTALDETRCNRGNSVRLVRNAK